MPLNAFTQEVRDQVVSLNREGCEKLRLPLSLRKIIQACKPASVSIPDWLLKGALDATLYQLISVGRYDLVEATMRAAGVLTGYAAETREPATPQVATNVVSGNGAGHRQDRPVQMSLRTALVEARKR